MIIGKRNSTFQTLDALKRNRVKRRQTGRFLVEGVNPIKMLIRHSWPVHGFVYAADRKLSSWARDLIEGYPDAERYALSPELMTELSDREETSELIVISERRDSRLETLTATGITLLLDRPSNPGNTGSMFRSADALGVNSVIVSGHGVDPYDTRVIRASVGAVFSVPFTLDVTNAEIERWVETQRARTLDFSVIGTSAKGTETLGQTRIPSTMLVVIGNETHGMSRFCFELCDTIARIPIGGAVSSLNVACAASIVLYEISKHQTNRAE